MVRPDGKRLPHGLEVKIEGKRWKIQLWLDLGDSTTHKLHCGFLLLRSLVLQGGGRCLTHVGKRVKGMM